MSTASGISLAFASDESGERQNRQYSEIAAFLVAMASKKPQDANAERVYRMALDLDPRNAEAHCQLGKMALTKNEQNGALVCFAKAINLNNPRPGYYLLWAEAWRRSGRFDSALRACTEALDLDDGCVAAYIQQAAIYQQTERNDEALDAIARGLAIDPANHDLLFSRALIELAHGDFRNGWRDFENRPSRLELLPKCAEHPEWTGESLDGKTLLIIGEQGLGDQIMFARFLEALPTESTVLFTKPELARLLEGIAGSIITSDRELEGLKPDYWIGIGSLPRWLAPNNAFTGISQVSGIDRFARLIPKTGNLRVGLCWAGNPQHRNDEQRSLMFEQLAPLLDVPGVDLYALQAGATSAQNDGRAFNLIAHCHDMADTAAAIMNLDLVITVDTAVLHLAGALGKPAWGLIQRPCDWRWGSGARTALYPSVELFRQRERGDWRTVIDQVRDRLCYEEAPEGGGETRKTTYEAKTANCRYARAMALYSNDAYIGRALEIYGEYSQSEADLLDAVLKPGDVVIEAGANIGGLTLPMAEAVGPNGKIWAFEPQPAYFELLIANCEDRVNIAACQGALGSENGTISIPGIPLDRIHAPGWKSDGPESPVPQMRIDTMQIDACALIKIDVDGQEQEILNGAEQTIARCRPFIYVENDKPEAYPELIPWLDAHGYRVYQHFAPLYNPENFRGYKVNVFGKIVSAMLFCVPKERYGFDEIVERFKLDRLVITR